MTRQEILDAVTNGDSLRDADLRDAELRYADICGADLRGANLRGANLGYATLRDANLRGADLTGANLDGADLRGANLIGADLRGADLRGVNLRGADLDGADLRGVNLGGANLTGAIGLPPAPAVPDLDARILGAIESGAGVLNMHAWHTCETTHCRAGWAITLAGPEGAALEAKLGPAVAGALIYAASGRTVVPDFYCTDAEALEDIRKGCGK